MKIMRLSQNLQFVEAPDLGDREVLRGLRDAIVNEQLAVQQYEALADGSTNDKVQKVLQEIANEEKVHIGELVALLKELDPEEGKSLEEGAKEVEDH